MPNPSSTGLGIREPSTGLRPPTPSERLHRKIDLVMPSMAAASGRLLSHPEIRDAYPEFLVVLHGMIRAAVPLMETAAERARSMAPGDPTAARLVAYLEAHVEEERGHDEWVLEDLEVLGIDRARVLARVPSPTIAALVGSQYYWVLHHHPAALLGYLAALEGYPSTAGAVELVRTRSNVPPEAVRTLREHAELDEHHGDEIDRLIDDLPMSRELEEVLGLSAITSVHLAARVIEEVCDTVDGVASMRGVTEGT